MTDLGSRCRDGRGGGSDTELLNVRRAAAAKTSSWMQSSSQNTNNERPTGGIPLIPISQPQNLV